MSTIKRFTNIDALFEDMILYNQSFIKNEFVCDETNKPIIEGSTIYRIVELDEGHLYFRANKFNGTDLFISGDIITATKITRPENEISEYLLEISGLQSPLSLLGYKKR